MRSTTASRAPEYASAGRSNILSCSTLYARALRTGPIPSGNLLEYTPSSRLRPPSTFSTKTMSAFSSSVCGRASLWLSIFTAITGAGSAGSPVKGEVASRAWEAVSGVRCGAS